MPFRVWFHGTISWERTAGTEQLGPEQRSAEGVRDGVGGGCMFRGQSSLHAKSGPRDLSRESESCSPNTHTRGLAHLCGRSYPFLKPRVHLSLNLLGWLCQGPGYEDSLG